MECYKMTLTTMKENYALFAPDDWVILNEEDASKCKHVCVVSIPDAKKYGGNPIYVYFSNMPVNSMTPEYKKKIYTQVDRVWPHFLQLRCMEPELVVDDALHKAYLGEAFARMLDKQAPGAGNLFRETMSRVPDQGYMNYMKQKTGFDDEMMTAMLSHVVDPTIPRHGIFDIYLEGEYPFDGEPPCGAMIICARKEGMR